MRRCLLIAALVVAGCDDKPATPPPPETPPVLPPLPDLVLNRAALIDTQKFEALAAIPGTAALRWDLAENVKHVYTLKQVVTFRISRVPVGAAVVATDSVTQAEGTFVVDGRGPENSRARIRLETVRQEINGQPLPDELLKKIDASVAEYGVTPDGALRRPRVSSGNAPQLIEAVLGLPSKPLAPGESVETALDDAPTANSFGYKGRLLTKLTGWFRIARRECARLESDFDVEMLLPSGSLGKGRCRGRVVAYFCPAEGRFIQVEADIAYAQRSAVKASRESTPEGPLVWGIDSRDAESVLTARLKE